MASLFHLLWALVFSGVIFATLEAAGLNVEGVGKVEYQILYRDRFVKVALATSYLAYDPQFSEWSPSRDLWIRASKDGNWLALTRNYKKVDLQAPGLTLIGVPREGFAPFQSDGSWGFVDLRGEVAVQARYDWLGSFSEGRSEFELGKKYGYLDTGGRQVINPRFEKTTFFKGGKAIVRESGRWGVIDTKGDWLVEPISDGVPSVHEDIVLFQKSTNFSSLSANSGIYVSTNKGFSNIVNLFARKRLLWGMMNLDGRTLVEPRYDYISTLSNGLFAIAISNRYGVIDQNGETKTPPILNWIYAPSENIRMMVAGPTNALRYGFLRPDGTQLRAPEFSAASSFRNGYAIVGRDERYGLIDTNGKIHHEGEYDALFEFNDDRALFKKGYKWGFLGFDLKETIPVQYDRAYNFSNGLAVVNVQGKLGMIDTNGQYRVPPRFDRFERVPSTKVWLAQSDERWGLLNDKGEIRIEPQYEALYPFPLNPFLFRQKKLWGFLDENGGPLIEAKFESAQPFSEGLASFSENKLFGFINKSGEVVIQPQFEASSSFCEGRCLVRKGGKWGYIDRDGKLGIEARFDNALDFCFGTALVNTGSERVLDRNEVWTYVGGKWGIVGHAGDILIEPRFDELYSAVHSVGEQGGYAVLYIGKDRAQPVEEMRSPEGPTLFPKTPSTNLIDFRPRFESLRPLLEGVIVTAVIQPTSRRKYGLYFRREAKQIDPSFDFVWVLEDGTFLVMENQKLGLLNRQGEWILSPEYQEIIW